MTLQKSIQIKYANNLFLTVRADMEFIRGLDNLLIYVRTIYSNTNIESKRISLLKESKDGSYYCLSGFLSKIVIYANSQGYKIEFLQRPTRIDTSGLIPNIKGKILREDQKLLVRKSLHFQRGVVLSPTGTGKTVSMAALISCFEKEKIVFMCPNLSLLEQNYDRLKEMGILKLGKLGGGVNDIKEEKDVRVLVTTRQSLVRNVGRPWFKDTSVFIADECHIGFSNYGSDTYKILKQLKKCNVKVGFTATLPSTIESKLFLEGLLGPVIAKIEYKEAEDLSLIKTPQVKMISYSVSTEDFVKYDYLKAYEKCIVQNSVRNGIIVQEIKKQIENGHTILVFISRLEHGEILSSFLVNRNIDHSYVRGVTDKEARESIKKQLQEKSTRCVISSSIWREGINIPSLSCVIIAAGGKSITAILQQVGRALRTEANKQQPLIIDFIDNNPILSHHSKIRKYLYKKQGWLIDE